MPSTLVLVGSLLGKTQSLHWPGNCAISEVRPTVPPNPKSCVLGLQVYTTTPEFVHGFSARVCMPNLYCPEVFRVPSVISLGGN